MISEHEFVVVIRDDLYPCIRQLEGRVLALFNKHHQPGRGPTGVWGDNEIDGTICYLESATNMLKSLKKDIIKR